MMLRKMDWRHPKFYMQIDRDYSGISGNAMGIRFSTTFPQELIGSVPEEVYVNTIEGINALFEDTGRLGTTFESLLWYTTCTLVGQCRKTRMEKAMIKVHAFIYDQNDKIYHPIGLHFIHPLVLSLLAIGIRNISKHQLYEHEKPSETQMDSNANEN